MTLETWTTISDKIKNIDIKTYDNGNIALLVKRSVNDYRSNLYPYFNVLYNKNKYKKDCVSLLSLLKDTLLEYNPVGKIIYTHNNKVYTNKIKILGLHGHMSDDTPQSFYGDKYNFYFYCSFLGQGQYIPKSIKNVQIILVCRFLPRDKYAYGYCNTVDANYYDCNNDRYIRQDKHIGHGYGYGKCRVFPLIKGNPAQYCDHYQTGTPN